MPRKPKIKTAVDSPTVTFRLDDEPRQMLNGRAKILKIRRNDLARHYVMHTLGEYDERVRLQDSVDQLKADVQNLIKDQIDAIEVLLTSAGRMKAEDAQRWVEENFRSRL